MRELEKILKALANQRRLEIIKYLKENEETSVGEISKVINLSFRATSKHLRILETLDILEKNQKSMQVFYGLSVRQEPIVKSVISLL